MLTTQNYSNNSFSISIKNNTNKIFSSTEDSFGNFLKGNYIKFNSNDILYQISQSKKIFFLKDFELLNSKEIIINEDIGIYLQLNDTLDITVDEFQLETVASFENNGQWYKQNDIIITKGGDAAININNGLTFPTKFKVENVGINGEIINLSCIDNGLYIMPPINPVETITTNKEAVGAKLNLIYKIIPNKNILKRTIKEIRIEDGKTKIKLDYSLPPSAKNGSFSLQKWEIEISSIYLGETLINSTYKIIKDFTLNYQLPLMLKNTFTPDVVYNKSINLIDAKFKEQSNLINELIKEIQELKSKINF